MSASWDPELIKQAGEVTGTEARVIWHRHPDYGLSRWAPTVDLERDPRWGRNEEGYGENPVLTGKMAGAYIEGMHTEHALALPGRCAPQTAGALIAQTVLAILEERDPDERSTAP